MRAWVGATELYCCGRPFGLGEPVSWPLVGVDHAQRDDLGLTHRYEPHGATPDAVPLVLARVAAIRPVFAEYVLGSDPRAELPEPMPYDSPPQRCYFRARGTTVIGERHGRVDPREPDAGLGEGLQFEGYVVDLEP